MLLLNNKYLVLDFDIINIKNIQLTETDMEFITITDKWIIIKLSDSNHFIFYDKESFTVIDIVSLFLDANDFKNNILIDSKIINDQLYIYIIFNTHIYIQTIHLISFDTTYKKYNHPNYFNKTELNNIHISICKYSDIICYLIDKNIYLYNPFCNNTIHKKIHLYSNDTIKKILLHKSSLYIQSSIWIVEYDLENSLLNIFPKFILKSESIYNFYINTHYLYVFIKREFPRNKLYTMTGMLIYNSKTMEFINQTIFETIIYPIVF